jgi:hypothetical protein
MRISLIALICLAAAARPAIGQGDADEIVRGVQAGLDAGRRTSIVPPFAVAWSSAAALALTDDAHLNNNHIVTALAVNTAITAGLTWLSSLVLPPRPSGEQREFLATQPQLFVNSWRSGFRQTANKRRFAASALGVLSSVGVSFLIYHSRERPE